MLPHQVEVQTGCRIHFGLMEICPGAEACYSGLGLALPEPGYRVSVSGECSSDQVEDITIVGSDETQRRIRDVVENVYRNQEGMRLPGRIEAVESIPLHTGLGAGTQLACAVAVALEQFQSNKLVTGIGTGTDEGWRSVGTELARTKANPSAWLTQASGRGLRSAIGLKTFLSGGMVFDQGYEPSSGAGDVRVIATQSFNFPTHWRVLTMQAAVGDSVSGQDEAQRISAAAEQPNLYKSKMAGLVNDISAALSEEDFSRFSRSLDQYMELGATLFQQQQGGLYNGEGIASTVAMARQAGLGAVGQSSWGPTVFGFARTHESATEIQMRLKRLSAPIMATIHEGNFSGAKFRCLDY